jgi:hypothetical protein
MNKNIQGLILGVFLISLTLSLFFAGASSPFHSPQRPIFSGICLFIWGIIVVGSFSWEQHSFLFRAIVKVSGSHTGMGGRLGVKLMGLAIALFGIFCIVIGIYEL